MNEHKNTKTQDPLSNYLKGGSNLIKTLKTTAAITIFLLIIIVFVQPIFPLLLILIALAITINAYVMKATLMQWRKMLFYGVLYATTLHYLFMFAGRFGLIGIIFVIVAAVSFKLYKVKKRINKIFDEVLIK